VRRCFLTWSTPRPIVCWWSLGKLFSRSSVFRRVACQHRPTISFLGIHHWAPSSVYRATRAEHRSPDSRSWASAGFVRTALDWFAGESIIKYHSKKGLTNRGEPMSGFVLESLWHIDIIMREVKVRGQAPPPSTGMLWICPKANPWHDWAWELLPPKNSPNALEVFCDVAWGRRAGEWVWYEHRVQQRRCPRFTTAKNLDKTALEGFYPPEIPTAPFCVFWSPVSVMLRWACGALLSVSENHAQSSHPESFSTFSKRRK